MNDSEAMKEKKIYNYYAFVSYSHQDKKLAKKLQKWLESYRLPSALCKKYVHLPRKISPVFRDETDLTGTRVQDSLDRELDDSRYLIVLCSPDSAKSKYVNDEVKHFIALGREDYIIPVIVDGKPFSGEEQECFPPALRNIQPEILGIGLQDLGMRNAFLKMVSTMLRIRPDELIRRDKRRRIVRNTVSAAAVFLLAIAVSCTVWYNTEHSKYYNACIYRNEIPVGIYELSAAQRAVANNCFRITTLRGKVVRLETVNSKGVPSTVPLVTFTDPDYPVKKFSYDSSGKLATIESFDGTGKCAISEKLLYAESSHQITIDYYMPDSDQIHALPSELTIPSAASSQGNKSEITRRVNTYDDNGLLIKSMFYKGNLGTPACDSSGVYGQAYAYNQTGQTECISNLNAAGEIRNCKYGWAEMEFRYNEMGKMVFEKCLTEDGSAAREEEGYNVEQITCDENGNYIQRQFFDETGHLCNGKQGYAQAKFSYDEKGFLTSQKFFDVQGLPAYRKEGYHEMRVEYDKNGRWCGVSYYDTDSKPLYIKAASAASIRDKLDDSGKLLERWWYGAQGNNTCNIDLGVFGERWEYDKNGYLSTVSYLDTQGKPMMSKEGYASWRCTYDQRGNPVRYEFYDVTEKLVRNKYNTAILKNTFDVFGNRTGCRIFDEGGVPCYDADGISSYEWHYENGCLISEKYFDVNGQPMLYKDGYHELQWDYDERGNCIRSAYYDTEGNPVMRIEDDVSVIEYDYNEYGDPTQFRFYDIDGNPVLSKGQAEYGGPTQFQFYDINEKLVLSTGQAFRYELTYDAVGNVIEQRHFGTDGELIKESTGGWAKEVFQYDFRGNLEKVVLYNENDEPYGTEEQPIYCAEYLRDKGGFNTGYIYYDKKGNVISQTKYYACILYVEPETAGIMPGDILLRWDRWDYFDDSESDSALYDFRVNMSLSEDDVFILCRIQEDGSYLFYRVSGISRFSTKYVQDTTSNLEDLMTAYQQWLEENPA